MAPKPVVTGLSPKEGPPGTKITIRGEFLGNRAEDLIGEFTICVQTLRLKTKEREKILV